MMQEAQKKNKISLYERKMRANVQNWFDKGYQAQSKAEYGEACVCYRKVTEIDERNVPAFNNWADSLHAIAKLKGDVNIFKRAFKKYAKAVSIDRQNPLVYNNWANAVADMANLLRDPDVFEEAFEKYRKALQYAPKEPTVYNNWGSTLADLAFLTNSEQHYREACEKFDEAVRIKPDFASAYYKSANLLAHLANQKLGKEAETLFADAFERYAKAADLQPDNPLVYNDWGVALSDKAGMTADNELYEDSYRKFEKAVELQPQMAAFYYNWANALSAQGELKQDPALYEASFAKYAQSTKLQPDNISANYNYALAIIDLARMTGSLETDYVPAELLLRKVISLAQDPNAMYNLACLYALLGRKEEAIGMLSLSLQFRYITTAEELEEDADLASLKDEPQYQALIKTYFSR